MGRFPGKVNTDVYGVQADEMRLVHIQYSAAQTAAAAAEGILKDEVFGTGAARTISTFIAQPPCPRNLTLVASGTQTGKVTVYGTNIADDPISEVFTMNSATPVVGTKAFKTITSVVVPVKAGSEVLDMGYGQLIGLPFLFANKPMGFALNDYVLDTTPTFTVDADEIEKNVVDFNGSLDGSVMDLFLAV